MGLGKFLVQTGTQWFLSGGRPSGGNQGTAAVGSFQATWPLSYEQEKGDFLLGRVMPRDSLTSFGHQHQIAHKAICKQHLAIFAPTRYGKGVNAIMPNVLLHPGSTFIVDPKAESYLVAAQALKAKGYKVVLLDPLRRAAHRLGVRRTGDECGFNALGSINPYNDPQAPRQIDELAEILIEAPPGSAQHAGAMYWIDQTRIIVAGILAFSLVYQPKSVLKMLQIKELEATARLGREPRPEELGLTISERRQCANYSNIVKFCANFSMATPEDRIALVKLMLDFEDNQKAMGLPLPTVTRQIKQGAMQAATLLGKSSYAEGVTTLISMMAKSFKWVTAGDVIDDLSGLDFKFDMRELKTREKVAVFAVLPESSLNTHGPWLRMAITSAINTISEVDWAPGVNEPVDGLRIPTNMFLDEVAQYGNIPVLERALSMSAGSDLRIVTICQSKAQLDKLYTPQGAATIMANSAKLAIGVGDPETGEYLSRQLGKTYSRDERTGQKGDDKVALLGPDELMKATHWARGTSYYIENGRDPIEVRECAYHSAEDTGLVAGRDYTPHREHTKKSDYMPGKGQIATIAAKPKGYKAPKGEARLLVTQRPNAAPGGHLAITDQRIRPAPLAAPDQPKAITNQRRLKGVTKS